MRKKFMDYYALVILVLFIVYNLVLESLKIYGLLYQVFMFLIIIVNAIILIVFRRKIKYKTLIIIVYVLIWLFSKNTLQCFFAFSNIILLCVTGFMENHSIQIISILIVVFGCIFFLPLFFIFLMAFGTGLDEEKGMNDIYDDMHYYCNNNYEVYSYSAGAMDSFHYSIDKHYEILNIGGIINVSYNERNEKTHNEYEAYLETHNCKLVGGKNGSK
jgi:hypothetical protein